MSRCYVRGCAYKATQVHRMYGGRLVILTCGDTLGYHERAIGALLTEKQHLAVSA